MVVTYNFNNIKHFKASLMLFSTNSSWCYWIFIPHISNAIYPSFHIPVSVSCTNFDTSQQQYFMQHSYEDNVLRFLKHSNKYNSVHKYPLVTQKMLCCHNIYWPINLSDTRCFSNVESFFFVNSNNILFLKIKY